MELKDLVGERLLTGVDMLNESIFIYSSLESCEVINFTLDGKTYSAIEDPSDGYRSSMKELKESDKPTSNTFPPVKVICRMKDMGGADGRDILECVCAASRKVVLEVGTDNTDDYYPSWVACFTPENFQ